MKTLPQLRAALLGHILRMASQLDEFAKEDQLVTEAQQLLRELKAAERRLEARVRYLELKLQKDPMTKALTKSSFRRAVTALLAHGQREGEDGVPGKGDAVIFTDGVDFGAINKRFGHEGGDRVILAFAETLRQHLRREDIEVLKSRMKASGRSGRFGGDEFLVFIPWVTEEEAMKIAERLREAIRSTSCYLTPKVGSRRQRHVLRAHIGVGWSPRTRRITARELIALADGAVVDAKSGTDIVVRCAA